MDKICDNCKFMRSRKEEGWPTDYTCHRYPEDVMVRLGHWCGEFKRAQWIPLEQEFTDNA